METLFFKQINYNLFRQGKYNNLSINMKFFYLSLAIGTLIRLIGLDFQSLGAEELHSVVGINQESFVGLYKNWLTWEYEANPPFYYIFLYYWVKVFGESPVSIRLPSAIAGILSIYFMYRYTKNFFNEEVAVMSSVMISFSYAGLYYSQEARAYSFLILFSILSTFYWIKLQINTDSKVYDVIKYVIIILLTAYTHYFGLLLVSIQLCYWVFNTLWYKKSIKYPVVAILAFMLVYLPWAIVMIDSLSRLGGGNFWIQRPTFSLLFSYIKLLFRPASVSFYLLIIAPLFFGFKYHMNNLITFLKKQYKLGSTLFALSFLTAAVIIVSFAISFHTPILTERNLLSIAPIIIIFISLWIKLSALKKKRSVSYVFLSCLLCLYLFLPTYYKDTHKTQWREAAFYVMEETTDQSLIVMMNPWYAEMFNYYFRYHKYDCNKVAANINGVQIDDIGNVYDELIKLGANDLFILEYYLYFDNDILDYYKEISKNYQIVIYGPGHHIIKIHHFAL